MSGFQFQRGAENSREKLLTGLSADGFQVRDIRESEGEGVGLAFKFDPPIDKTNRDVYEIRDHEKANLSNQRTQSHGTQMS